MTERCDFCEVQIQADEECLTLNRRGRNLRFCSTGCLLSWAEREFIRECERAS